MARASEIAPTRALRVRTASRRATSPSGVCETTPADIVSGMLEIYPDWGNLRTLWYSAKAGIDRKGS
jgi:hypothetical protein